MSLKCIVAGTGRSGTVFMARLLTSLGVPCGHESIFDYSPEATILKRLADPNKRTLSNCSLYDLKNNESIDKWVEPAETVADASYLVVPHLHKKELRDIPLIHIVRNPVKVITSYLNDFNYFAHRYPNRSNPYNHEGWEDRIYDFLPELSQIKSPVERACFFYCRWNLAIETRSQTRPYFFSQIEKLDIKSLCDFLEVPVPEKHFSNDKINSNRRKEHTLNIPEGTIKAELEALVERYGYEL